jgi:hypothetical protein
MFALVIVVFLASSKRDFAADRMDQANSDIAGWQIRSLAWEPDSFRGLGFAEDLSLFGLTTMKEISTRWAGGLAAFPRALGRVPNLADHGASEATKETATSAAPRLIGPLPTD